MLVAITLTILFVSGIPWQHFAAIGAAAALIAGGAYRRADPPSGVHFLHGYQQDRLTAFLHPSDDPSDASYQVNQAVIAVGSGERSGRGDDATQTELLFLPERHTDFIYAVIGERFGFLGAAFVVFLYALLFWRAIRVMRISTSFYGTMIAGGVVAMLAFQMIVNVGMNLGLMPVTGITLPADELRRLVRARDVPGARAAAEHPRAVAARTSAHSLVEAGATFSLVEATTLDSGARLGTRLES